MVPKNGNFSRLLPLRKKWGKNGLKSAIIIIFAPLALCLIVTANPIMLMTKKSYHSMEEQGGGGGEFLNVDKGEHVNKVTLPGFEACDVCYPMMVVLS